MRLLTWLTAAPLDEVTPATRGWLAAERDARIAELEAKLAASEDEKRRFQRMYGKASAEIGRVRAELAREREARQLDGGDILASATAVARAQRLSWGPKRDAALVATAEHLGNEVGPDRTAAIDAVVSVLQGHHRTRQYYEEHLFRCECGHEYASYERGEVLAEHQRHVAGKLVDAGMAGPS